MNVFLTGGSGFLGEHTIPKLLLDEHRVYALARSPQSSEFVQQLGAIPVHGDIKEVGDFKNFLRGCQVVVHCAAPVEFWGPWEKFSGEIIESTLKLAKASADNGVKRFIYISSEAAVQGSPPLENIDESHPYPKKCNSLYGQAKKKAEMGLIHAQKDMEMEILILRPSFIWGNGAPAFKAVSSKVQSGQFLWIDRGKASFEAVHVENIAEAIRLSLSNGKSGEIYFVTDGVASTVREFFTQLFESLELPTPQKTIPKSLARPTALSLEKTWKAFRREAAPPLTLFDIDFVSQPRRYRIEKIQKDLGYSPLVEREFALKNLTPLHFTRAQVLS